MKNIEDYIIVFENIVPHSLCDAILKEFNDQDEWSKTLVGTGNVDSKIRTAEAISLSYPEVIAKNTEVRKKIDHDVFISAGMAIKKYNQKFPLAFIEEDSGYELLRYKEGQFYIQHTDSYKVRPRAVSCSFALNDDYEGGEWGFFNREMVLRAPKGSAVLFPSNFMYPHEIMPVVKGIRYSIVTWFI